MHDTPHLHRSLADGLEEHELQEPDMGDAHHVLGNAQERDSHNLVNVLSSGSALISSIACTQRPASDFDPTIFTCTHPWAFPLGTRGKP